MTGTRSENKMHGLQEDSDSRELDFPSRSIRQSVLITSELFMMFVNLLSVKSPKTDLNAENGR